jgi:hypothetical protein
MLCTSIQACHGHHYIGVAEAKPVDQNDMLIRIGDLLAYEVLASHAEMHNALRQQVGDLGRRGVRHLDPGKIGDRAAAVAHATRTTRSSPVRRRNLRVLLQPALAGTAANSVIMACPAAARRSVKP